MKNKVINRCSKILIFFSVLIMASIIYFESSIPDMIYISSGEEISMKSYKTLISFSDSSETAEVFKSENGSYSSTAKLFDIIPVKDVSINISDEKTVTVCGFPFGVKMFSDGVLVVGFSQIPTKNGTLCPALSSGFKEGDIIYKIDSEPVCSNEDISVLINSSGGENIDFSVLRDDEEITLTVSPAKNLEGDYKIGIWIRDSSAGIGTMTYYDDESGIFAGLGHPICDASTGEVMPLLSGEIVKASIKSVKKGISGAPGELCGLFYETEEIGTLEINDETGLYGITSCKFKGTEMKMAHKQNIEKGSAKIISTINGNEPKEYEIEIESIDLSDDCISKNMVIRVTDEELIKETGGIVQGMSGSPIIQNGQLVGAITHVSVNGMITT